MSQYVIVGKLLGCLTMLHNKINSSKRNEDLRSIVEPNDDAKERQLAELEFVSVAYSHQEAWVSTSNRRKRNGDDDDDDNDNRLTSKHNCVHRRLDLPLSDEYNSTTIHDEKIISLELILTMPLRYPTDPSCTLEIQAMILNDEKSSFNDVVARKMAMDAIPQLVHVCHEVASDEYLEEAILAVFTRADDWVETEWIEFVTQRKNICNDMSQKKSALHSIGDIGEKSITEGHLVLGRKLIFSHHIIAKTKRKALKELSREYRLGGYAKIGWPGIIIIEGEEIDCNRFVDEIRTMRWQHLVVRGEEEVSVPKNEDLDALRKFPLEFEELGEDKMSYLAKVCDDVGLKELFMTSMKIYTESESNTEKCNDDDKNHTKFSSNKSEDDRFYGVLLHIDHMNDEKGYSKWIQKSCKSVNCNYLLKKCHLNNDMSKKPIIIICLWGDMYSVKQVLKRWRTSRVDVDSRGNPCLERMMDTLTEGTLPEAQDLCDASFDHEREVTLDELKLTLQIIGGTSWVRSFTEQLL